MSESRFDFLRELVKNVPDINVAEEQAINECETTKVTSSYVPANSPPPPSPPPLTSSHLQTSLTLRNTRSNGNKLSYVPPPSSSGESSMVMVTTATQATPPLPIIGRPNTLPKQQSIDLSYNATMKRSDNRANYYMESLPVEPSLLEAGPPKLLRNDTATVAPFPSIPASTFNEYLQPVMSFDLTKKLKPAPPPLSPLIIDGTQTQRVAPAPSTTRCHISTPPTYANIDVCNSPLVKIDYSKMDLSTPPIPLKLKKHRRASNCSAAATTVRQKLLNNIDLSSHTFTTAAPQIFNFTTPGGTSSPTTSTAGNSHDFTRMLSTPTTNSLDMDEDYDNI